MTTAVGQDAETRKRLLEGFRKCSTCQVVDAMELLGLPDVERCTAAGLRPVDMGLPTMVGFAVTVYEGPRRVGIHEGIRVTKHVQTMRQMKPDEVMVLSAGGVVTSSNWGGLITLEAMRRGISGIVVDGMVRDIDLILKTKLPVFAKGSNPLGTHVVMETLTINQPVVCSGVTVYPGDIVIGDASGVCFVPYPLAEKVLKASLNRAGEEEIIEANLWKAPLDMLEEAHRNYSLKF